MPAVVGALADAVTGISGVANAAKRGAGVGGYFRAADGTLKKGNTFKAAAGAGAAGLGAWALFDPKAGEKIGGKAGDIGGAFGNLFGGGIMGLLSGLLRPEFMIGSAVSSCSSCGLILVFFLMK